MLQITPASTNPTFTERKLWNTFRVCGRDDQQGAVAGAYIAATSRARTSPWCTTRPPTARVSRMRPRRRSTRPASRRSFTRAYNKGDKDFNALVSKLKLNNIDLVYVGGYHQEAGLILRQMRDQGVKTVLMAGDALADKEFASITGPAADGVLFTFGPDPRNKATAKAIVDKFKAKNIDPEGYTLYTYAAFQVWTQAVAKAKTTDAKKVAGVMKEGSYDTVLGKLSFDAKGDITILDYVVYKWDAKDDTEDRNVHAAQPRRIANAPATPGRFCFTVLASCPFCSIRSGRQAFQRYLAGGIVLSGLIG